MSVKQLTQMSMLIAISIVLTLLFRFPIIPAAPFLEYTPGDIPLFMSAFLYGPAAGLILAVATAIIQGVTVSAHSGPIGIIMNIFSTGSFVLAAGLIYRKNKNAKGAIAAVIVGVAAVCISMIGFNLIFTPIFMGVPRDVVVGMILPAFLPFNLIRAGANAVVALVAWRTIASIIPHVGD